MGPGRLLDGQGLTRRSLLLGSGGLALLGSACKRDDDEAALMASAARGSERQSFLDSVGWTELDGLTAVVAFVPFRMSEEQRRAVLDGRSVFPALPSGEPILEMRLEIKPGRNKEDLRITTGTLRSVQLTFWYFDEPAPVIRIATDDWQREQDVELVGLDGIMKRDGWVLGTIRGKQVYKNMRDVDEAYLWNVRFVQSLV